MAPASPGAPDDSPATYAEFATDVTAWSDEADTARIERGGGWFDYAMYCRSAFRYENESEHCDFNLGFQPARS